VRAGAKRERAPDSQATDERVAPVGALDDIFGGLAPKKKQRDAERLMREAADAAAAAEEAAAARKRAKKAKRERIVDPVFGEAYDLDSAIDPQNASVHRFDSASGLRVYKAHALGLGRGGGTPLCPFDCKCCF
jgi:membrane protein involved in colicin uptake